mmetsp:Transcript_7171/g.20055  ORF Transcript_7171/g.20055 Transcript_7171/m.20055 type:complete len:110 (-) Transcript_7171:2342-2671(-)
MDNRSGNRSRKQPGSSLVHSCHRLNFSRQMLESMEIVNSLAREWEVTTSKRMQQRQTRKWREEESLIRLSRSLFKALSSVLPSVTWRKESKQQTSNHQHNQSKVKQQRM